MTQRAAEPEFQTRYETTSQTGPAEGDILVVENSINGQLSEIDISGDDRQEWALDTRDNDSTNDDRRKNWNLQDFTRGDFEDPVTEFGAGREVALRAVNTLTSGNVYTINMRIDELHGQI